MNLTRREILKAMGFAGASCMMPNLAMAEGRSSRYAKQFIFVNLQGAPSQLELFDPKPGLVIGGPTKAIKTRTKGLSFSENLSGLADLSDNMAVFRMASSEGNHQRAQYVLQTGGYKPVGVLKHAGLSSIVGKFRQPRGEILPSSISLGNGAVSAGYLGVNYDPFTINPGNKKSDLLIPESELKRIQKAQKLREKIWKMSPYAQSTEHQSENKLYEQASDLLFGDKVKLFDLSEVSEKEKALYGKGNFANSCLLASRLIHGGAPSVQINLGGWDTHQDNFTKTTNLGKTLDAGLSQLIRSLKASGRYNQTLILVAGEFGRTPRINANEGRDHWTKSWSAVLAGGMIKGSVIGESNDEGITSSKLKPNVEDLSFTTLRYMGIDPNKWIQTSVGRPIKLSPGNKRLI